MISFYREILTKRKVIISCYGMLYYSPSKFSFVCFFPLFSFGHEKCLFIPFHSFSLHIIAPCHISYRPSLLSAPSLWEKKNHTAKQMEHRQQNNNTNSKWIEKQTQTLRTHKKEKHFCTENQFEIISCSNFICDSRCACMSSFIWLYCRVCMSPVKRKSFRKWLHAA